MNFGIFRTLLTVAASALLLSAGCKFQDGSETNWFGRCYSSNDCGTGECTCGVCTSTCSSSTKCGDGSGCGTGEKAAYAAQCGAPAPAEQGICQPVCGVGHANAELDRACATGQSCIDGLCAWTSTLNIPTVSEESPPPPISGGTMTIIAGGHAAAVSDPDHDQVVIVDLDGPTLGATIPLAPGDEPGRIVEDSLGRVHVALRRGGALVSIDPKAGRMLQRRAVCQYPRGVAYQPATNALIVACAGGELVTLSAESGPATNRVKLDDDLRDVVVDGDQLLVSRFRSAEILVVSSAGIISNRFFVKSFVQPPVSVETPDTGFPDRFPAVAWRMVPTGVGGAYLTLQYQRTGDRVPVAVTPGGYTGGGGLDRCGHPLAAPVEAGIVRVDALGTVSALRWSGALPVDVAVAPYPDIDRLNMVAMVAAGNRSMPSFPARASVFSFVDDRVHAPLDPALPPPSDCVMPMEQQRPGDVIAVGYDYDHQIVTQSRDPWVITTSRGNVELPGPARKDTGHYLFHTATPGGIACASCHPEGHEDGFVWTFSDHGPRRTQSLAGGVSSTAPFHWEGDMSDLDVLLSEVMTKRMGGFELSHAQGAAVAHFIDTMPAWRQRDGLDLSAVQRGQALFESTSVGCSSCHAGSRLTNNHNMDVGTDGAFQVPSLLGVSRRAPYLHDGRAPTLAARLAGGRLDDKHGHLSQLTASQQADLLSYLESL